MVKKIAITLIIRGQQVKRLCYVAEPSDCFNLRGEWVVMAHNLDDAGDVDQLAAPSLLGPKPRLKHNDLNVHLSLIHTN